MIELPVLFNYLDNTYPDSKCFLFYGEAHELLFATILSAQCTDDRVNIVTRDLFASYKKLEDYANANIEDMENIIHSVGFYRNKAKNIIASAAYLIDKFQGRIPDEMDSLLELPGVGRKTANLILGHIYNKPGIVVDTHVARVSQRLGLTGQKDPTKIEFELMDILPEERWILFNTQIIAHGRAICSARKANCIECQICDACPKVKIKHNTK